MARFAWVVVRDQQTGSVVVSRHGSYDAAFASYVRRGRAAGGVTALPWDGPASPRVGEVVRVHRTATGAFVAVPR
jgi:hypothetical protein